VLLPEPAGPSIAMTSFSLSFTANQLLTAKKELL